MYKLYLLIFALLLGVSSCALFENFDEEPMFIEVNSVGLETTFEQGTNRHNIVDIWPSADGQSIGVFELPITFPVVGNGPTTTMFYQAGINRVGQGDDHTPVSYTHLTLPTTPYV